MRRYSDELRERVLETYHAECATSPHASDSKRKRLAPHVYVKAQALVVMSGLQSIYDAHLRRFPQDKDKLSFAGFKNLKPWYATRSSAEAPAAGCPGSSSRRLVNSYFEMSSPS